ncbi:MbcA/ParS/Xre antitoxin family protein [Chelativorans intermedius]|uniref:MbcA/ParS/Xre antitoxin family protein n=1 Tax=Chelativorans intermedius TaxID=515947 RepID=A0ABV6DBM1_9HYPH|nr:MbcA/ParS/Xre antitoxin family protein [Chelativorans intermedius]MCT9000447.1 MbcA/ParS/Xre antitoxin family protein [Chelativorans intermedius]
MVSPNSQTERRDRNIADRVAAKVTNALKTEKGFGPGSLALSALIAGEVAEVVARLPAEQRQELNAHSAELKQRIRRLFESFGRGQSGKISLGIPDEIEPSKGEGLGAIVTSEQGREGLAAIAVHRKLEDWAGRVAGATELSRNLGVARSSLNRWQHEGDVIGLLKGTRKHVYPVEQFIDGRPALGIRDIIKLAKSERTAWLWLSQRNPVLGGRKPIDLLKQDRVSEVVDAAAAYFAAQ